MFLPINKLLSEILMMIIELFKEHTMKFLKNQCLSCMVTKLLQQEYQRLLLKMWIPGLQTRLTESQSAGASQESVSHRFPRSFLGTLNLETHSFRILYEIKQCFSRAQWLYLTWFRTPWLLVQAALFLFSCNHSNLIFIFKCICNQPQTLLEVDKASVIQE